MNHENGVKWEIFISDKDFDNDDSDLVEIRLHNYINIKTDPNDDTQVEGKYRDDIVPLKLCGKQSVWGTSGTKKYCPDFNDNHIVYGDYASERHSWYRTAIHMCNSERRAKIGKTCKS